MIAFAVAGGEGAGAAQKPAETLGPAPTTKPKWNVCTEVLMVAMPLEKMLPLLPELRDPAKAEGAVTQLLAAIQRKEALLTGYPVVYSDDGQRGFSEAYLEKRYPTEFEPPLLGAMEPISTSSPSPAPSPQNGIAMPTAYETRNVGIALSVELEVRNGGKSIQFNVVPKRTELFGFENYEAAKLKNGIIRSFDPRLAHSGFLSLKFGVKLRHCGIKADRSSVKVNHSEG